MNTELKTDLIALALKIVTIALSTALSSFLLMILYNNFIAWEFNLPQFDIWAFILFRIVCLLWRTPSTTRIVQTKKNQ